MSEMTVPFVSIVVPVYNAEGIIERCISHLIAQDYPRDRFEIIIVDNNSKDKTAEIIKRFPVKYVFEKRQGVCFARNKGLESASGELIAYTDSDCFAEPDWISKLVSAFNDENIGGVGGHVAPYPAENLIEEYIAFREVLSQEKMFTASEYSPAFFITANVMYRTKILRDIGGFDNFFAVAGEDADIAWRVVDAGYKLKLESKAIVYHKHRSDLKRFWKQMQSYGIGSAAIFKKYRGKFGKKKWIYIVPYKKILKNLLIAPVYYFIKKDKFERIVPLLDLIHNIAFVIGKIKGSIKHKVLVL